MTCRRCGQVVCDRCSTHRANMARSQIVQDPSIPNWQQAQLATQPQRICDKCYTEMRPPTGSRSATAPPTQPQRIAGHGNGHIRRSTSSQSIMSECPVCGKRLSEVSLDKDVQEEHVQTCLNVGSPSVATVRYVSYKLPEQSPLIGQECLICFEEFEPGKSSGNTIARLTCLCSYHRPCIREWLEKGKGCPLHYQISIGL
ncbi:hypothetical protein INT43_005450 [Umbelopsis isabellina]|uniref:RING-type E3 ubiquitin transferase n=1 Tax=Mortierella isabellina TaxID=91625 RepID=A0A8H7PLP9_MORIS|nr:hypothetical protein INT43_005450 [Umbelopsis isabellina]